MMLVSQQKRQSSLHFGAVKILTNLHVGSDLYPNLFKSTDFSAIFFAIISPSIRINLHGAGGLRCIAPAAQTPSARCMERQLRFSGCHWLMIYTYVSYIKQ
jgi:hypothetical protein